MSTNCKSRCRSMIVGVAVTLAGVCTGWAGADGTSGDPFVKVSQPPVPNVSRQPPAPKAPVATITVAATEQSLEQKMMRIVIPEFNFRNANITDVKDSFEAASRQYDDPALPPERRGVNFALKGVNSLGRSNDDSRHQITLTARYISLWDCLKLVTEMSDHKFHIRDNVVILMPSNVTDEGMETRSYRVLPNIMERAAAVARDLGSDKSGATGGGGAPQQNLENVFSRMGVQWPLGSSISYLASMGNLRVVNTTNNLTAFEKVLGEMNVTPCQVEIEVQFVAFDPTNVEKLVASGGLNIETLTKLWIRGSGHLLAAPRVTTHAGQEAVIKETTAVNYPTEFSIGNVANGVGTATKNVPSLNGGIVIPGTFATREVGTILQVVPEISAEGDMINMTLNPQIVGEPGWHDYGSKYLDSDGKELQVRMEQPFFPVSSVSTSVTVTNGQRILLGGGNPTPDGKQMVYVFVTGRLVKVCDK